MSRGSSPRRLQIARLFGVPIYIHFSWLIIFGLITWTLATGYFPSVSPDLPTLSYWARGLVASLLFFASILLHELGHALVALRNGVGIRSITLFVFGGVAQMERDPTDGWTELKIAAAGPLVSVALAGAFAVLASLPQPGSWASSVAGYLALINLALALFNLVPAFPLDGGRLLRGLLWKRLGKVRATQIAATAGRAFAFLLIISGALRLIEGEGISGMWYILIGWFLQEASSGAYRGARLDESLAGVRVRDAMLTEVATLPAHISVAEAAREHFLRTGYGGYPVVRDEELVGLLGLRDVLKLPAEEREQVSVQAAMMPLSESLLVAPEEPLRNAVTKMAERGSGRLLVVEQARLVGFLTMSAVIRSLKVREELTS